MSLLSNMAVLHHVDRYHVKGLLCEIRNAIIVHWLDSMTLYFTCTEISGNLNFSTLSRELTFFKIKIS